MILQLEISLLEPSKRGKRERERGGRYRYMYWYNFFFFFRNVLYELNLNLTEVRKFSWPVSPGRVSACEGISFDDVRMINTDTSSLQYDQCLINT